MSVQTQHDVGFRAGVRAATVAALRTVRSHIDRLEPGRQQRIREALELLHGSLYSELVVRPGFRDSIGFDGEDLK